MAIIYSYPKNTDILETDVIVGTSTKLINGKRKNITKNFEIGSISEFYNENSSIAIAGQNNFFFQKNIAPGRKAGNLNTVFGSALDELSIVLDADEIVRYKTGEFKPGSVGIGDGAATRKEPIQFWN
jgi:hypothetical protein